jgi:TPR repeat protein
MRAAAEAGHGLAQHGLGFMYLEGECAEKDPARAAEWFRKAAEQGLQGSMTTLGLLYEEGRGVPRDPDEARRWYRLAGFEM